MSTQGSVKGCQISFLLWGGSVCIQTGWEIGNVHRMEPGSRNWVPTTLVLVPLWDVTVGELQLFSGITEILAEIEQNWKYGQRILFWVMRARSWHSCRHTALHSCSNKCKCTFKETFCYRWDSDVEACVKGKRTVNFLQSAMTFLVFLVFWFLLTAWQQMQSSTGAYLSSHCCLWCMFA